MKRERLTRERILESALGVAEREGLRALTMRRVGRELGVEGMALYHYVRSKEALLDGIVELLSERIGVPPSGDAHAWPEAIRELVRSYRRVARAHPHTFPLFVLRPLGTQAAVARAEVAVDLLRRAGFDERGAVLAFRTLASYAGGFVLEELTGSSPRVTTGDREAEFEFGLDVVLVGLDAKRRPAATSGSDQTRSVRPSPAPPEDRGRSARAQSG